MPRFSQHHLRGWNAACSGQPFDHFECGDWKEGFRLQESQQASKQRWSQLEGMSVASH